MPSRIPVILMALCAASGFALGTGRQSLTISGDCAILASILGPDSAVSGLDSSSPGPEVAVSYRYALKPTLDVGADTGFFLLGTKVGRSFLLIPLAVSGRWTPGAKRFEFPVDFGVGIAYSNYGGTSNLDPMLNLKLGAGYRLNQSFTVGLDESNSMLIQWFHRDSSQDRIGYFPALGIFVTYHWNPGVNAP